MQGLRIPPHSSRLNGPAVTVLAMLAVAAFSFGLGRQIHPAQALPFPSAVSGPPG